MRKLPLIMTIGVYLSFLALGTQAGTQASKDDLSYRSAFYNYTLGQYVPARTTLLQAAQQASQPSNYRQMLLARVYVEQGRYLEAQQVFAEHNLDDVPSSMRDDTLFALTRLYYAQGNCKEALKLMAKKQQLSSEQDAHSRFIRASCKAQQDTVSVETLQKAERILLDGAKRNKNDEATIWFAYGFYNLAVAAANIKQLTDADDFYSQALNYVGSTGEGRALVERIRLSRAEVNFVLNRYDYAISAYKELPLEGYWQDQALLGYGWAAFKNYQSDVALEAWQQLINLPYKSMSVYQGYLVIPYAYERANAFMQAITAYDYAMEQYAQVSKEIDSFSAQLTLQKINDHAVRYYHKQGDGVDPIHPLLAATYTQVEFRGLVEKIGVLTGYKQQLAKDESMLQMQSEYQQAYDRQAAQRKQLQQQLQQKTQQGLVRLAGTLPSLVDNILQVELDHPEADKALAKLYQSYNRVSKAASQLKAGSEKQQMLMRVNRIQNVLLFKLAERRRAYSLVDEVHQLISRQQMLNVRFNEYLSLTEQRFEPVVNDDDMEAMSRRIISAREKVDQQLVVLQKRLLAQTQSALAEQRQQIEQYRSQARIASANLKEDFYQRGGSRLWY